MKTIKLEVDGRVQGVNFRSMVHSYACENGIKGYVRNLDDGGVEIVAQGDDDKLRKFLSWLKRSPGFSKVKNVFVEDIDDEKSYENFMIVRENFLKDKKKSFFNLGRGILKI